MPHRHLKRSITLFEATMYALCVIIGAGIYVLVGAASGVAGNGVWLSFLFAALIAGCSGLSYAELSSKMPRDAAEYEYVERGLGSKRLAFGVGWLKLVSSVIAAAAVSLGFGGYLHSLAGFPVVTGALLLVALAVLLNLFGAQSAMKVAAFFVLVTISGLLIIVFSGAGHLGSVDCFDLQFGWGGVFSAAALIFFAFLGFEEVANLGEEAKKPRSVLPKALIISIVVSTLLYTLVALIAISVVPWQALSKSSSPLSDVANVTLGPNGSLLLTLIALVATASTTMALLFSYSRMIFGMAEDGSMPRIFLRLSRNGTPWLAVLATGAVTALVTLMGDIKFVASVTDFGALFVFLAINLALIILRYKPDRFHGQFTVPLNIGRFPVLPAAGALFCGYMLTRLDTQAAFLSIAFLAVGIALYVLFIENREKPVRSF
ncbi:MAG: APC family permease [Candidatus Aenigmatarchaeota archaeon]